MTVAVACGDGSHSWWAGGGPMPAPGDQASRRVGRGRNGPLRAGGVEHQRAGPPAAGWCPTRPPATPAVAPSAARQACSVQQHQQACSVQQHQQEGPAWLERSQGPTVGEVPCVSTGIAAAAAAAPGPGFEHLCPWLLLRAPHHNPTPLFPPPPTPHPIDPPTHRRSRGPRASP